MNNDIWETHTVLFNKKLINENKKKNLLSKPEKRLTQEHYRNKKFEEHSDSFKHQKINKKISELIRDGRNNKGMTRKELAKNINVPLGIINNYENGSVITDNKILGKIEKHLNIKLRGKLKD